MSWWDGMLDLIARLISAGEKRCVRCGDCCRKATRCDLRRWVTRDVAPFTSPCDQLLEYENGTTACKVIQAAIDNTLDWHEPTRRWIVEEFVGRGCQKSPTELRDKYKKKEE